jgi:DNA-binding PadR family transcriptional regulator
MAGWDLAHRVEATIGDFWNVTPSQIYRELRTMEERGLVEAGETGSRERRPYAITKAGRAAFAGWIAQEPGDDVIRSPLLLTVFFGEHVDRGQMDRFLAIHRLRHQRRLDRYQELAASLSGARDGESLRHALRYGIEHEQAVLRWFAGFEPAAAGDSTTPPRQRRARTT